MGAWHHTYGLPVLISNCSNNFGPCHFPEKLIPLIILNALEGKLLPDCGQGENVRDRRAMDQQVFTGIRQAILTKLAYAPLSRPRYRYLGTRHV